MPGQEQEYVWRQYTDDAGGFWAVKIRKRIAWLGGFTQVVIPPLASYTGHTPMWPWQNIRMRHLGIRLDNGKIMKVPVASLNSDVWSQVGSRIQFPTDDAQIQGLPPSGEHLAGTYVAGTITGRTGERPGRNALQYLAEEIGLG